MSKTGPKTWLQTPVCQQLEIEHPILSVGMGGGMAGPELVAAVSNARACGVLGMGGLPAAYIRQQIQHLRTLTDKPFGANIILPLLQEGQIETCLDEQIPLLVLFWGDPQPYVAGTTIEVPRYGIFPPMPGFQGDTEHAALYAGESCSLIHDIKPAGQIVRDIVQEAESILEKMQQQESM